MSINDCFISIIVPCYNEEQHIYTLLESLNDCFISKTKHKVEVIVVDDGSSDRSQEKVSDWININRTKDIQIVLVSHENNRGKGAAIRSGVERARGNVILIQDGDLEYNPIDIHNMLNHYVKHSQFGPVAVYGTRLGYVDSLTHRIRIKWRKTSNQKFANWFFAHLLSVIFFVRHQTYISDLLTGYKMVPKKCLQDHNFVTERFQTDHEISKLLIRNKIPIIEVPIDYRPRGKMEGKKIGLRDAIDALAEVLR